MAADLLEKAPRVLFMEQGNSMLLTCLSSAIALPNRSY